MLKSSFFLAFALSLIGCVKKSVSTTTAFSNDWSSLKPGDVLTLEVITQKNTYFKESDEMVRGNENYSAKKCGLKLGARAQFKFQKIYESNKKYAVVELQNIEQPEKNTFAEEGSFCSAGNAGFLFKSDFAIVDKKSPTEAESPTSNTVAISSLSNSNSSRTNYIATDSATTLGDAYVQSRTNRFNLQKSQGRANNYMTVVIRSKAYSKDGQLRFYGRDGITKKAIAVEKPNLEGSTDMTAKSFKDWEGNVGRFVLIPLNNSDIYTDTCETRVNGTVSRYENGRGITLCTVPKDETGTSWVWINCNDFTSGSLNCGTTDTTVFSAQ